jgi:hypothetical protein
VDHSQRVLHASGTTCNYYNTTIGKLASTTQNIYGVYDMNGGSWEYVMATTYNSAGTSVSIGWNATYNSGFYCGTSPTCTYYNTTDNITSGTALLPNAKYYDLYPYGTTYNDAVAYTRGKLGDATKEIVASSETTWYGSTRTSLTIIIRGSYEVVLSSMARMLAF